jgi:hypothetical protein
MSLYTINLNFQNWSDPENIVLVESSVWYFAQGGTWYNSSSTSTANSPPNQLSMNGSGTSGMLRFLDTNYMTMFAVAMGFNNSEPWSDIIVDLAPGDTLQWLHPSYYNEGSRVNRLNQKNTTVTSKADDWTFSLTYDDNPTETSVGPVYTATLTVVWIGDEGS